MVDPSTRSSLIDMMEGLVFVDSSTRSPLIDLMEGLVLVDPSTGSPAVSRPPDEIHPVWIERPNHVDLYGIERTAQNFTQW